MFSAVIFLTFACFYQISLTDDHIKKRELLAKDKSLFKELRDKLTVLEKRLDSRSCDRFHAGYIGGSSHTHKGAAVNYLCMPKNPDWDKYANGIQGYRAYLYGTEYEMRENSNGIPQSYHDYESPCAVCRALGTSSTLMIPGRYNHEAASQYICVDGDAENVGSNSNKDGALLYPVEAICGSLKCPPYVGGRELACVVCSK
ncbi:hypothetical protein FSP39_006587 [Pinctada imbricata]|uniref:Short-chain collagen C4-like n=1 Tax=Pinctada imbricata TaxID=66713 RepID=A0AA89BWZ9_PINIB|nr:hypothetical protein FSP39_006587 [Pinctada imbricata]